jgi:hypothetical protein
MTFSHWLVERNQRDATKGPKKRTGLELHMRAAANNISKMTHGKAGTIDYDKQKGSKGSRDRKAIDRSERGD